MSSPSGNGMRMGCITCPNSLALPCTCYQPPSKSTAASGEHLVFNVRITSYQRYVKYLLDLLYKLACFGTLKTDERKERIGDDTLGSEVFRKHTWADRDAAAPQRLHRRGARSGSRPHKQRRPRARRHPRARWDRATARHGTPRQRQACLHLRADAGSRSSIPEGVRAGATPATGCHD